MPIPATSEESRPPTLDKQQRSYLKELPKVTFLKMLLPFVRKRVEAWSTAYLFLYIDSHVYIYRCVSIYMIIHAYMYLHRYVNVNIYIFIHVITLIHTYRYVYIQIHMAYIYPYLNELARALS
jgi:hypothetical protein